MDLRAFLLHQEQTTATAVGPKGVTRVLRPAPTITIPIAAKRIRENHFSAMIERSLFLPLSLTTYVYIYYYIITHTHTYIRIHKHTQSYTHTSFIRWYNTMANLPTSSLHLRKKEDPQ